MTETHTPLPCPFCGYSAEIEEGSDHHGTWFNLGCSRHWGHVRNPDHTNTCVAGRIYYTETEVPLAEAITAWNTRADSHHRLVEAIREATQIATYLWRKHYRDDAPDWRPLPDLRGVISQIDNMVTGLIKEPTR